MNAPSIRILEAVAVCAELTGTNLSEAASRVMAEDLANYPERQILAALTRCRRELKGRLTIAEIISRIDDGRPGVEEAWAMVPKSEYETVVWTDEMATAMRNAGDLLDAGDAVGARMAFKESYLKLCQQARDIQKPVNWQVSLGYDTNGREGALIEAVQLGRLPVAHVQQFLPNIQEIIEKTEALPDLDVVKLLAGRFTAGSRNYSAHEKQMIDMKRTGQLI